MRVLIVFLCLIVFLPSCGWRRIAVERHQRSMALSQMEMERRQMELDCLKRAESDPKVNCAQYRAK